MFPVISQHHEVPFGCVEVPLSSQIMWLVSFILSIFDESVKSQFFYKFQVRLEGVEISLHYSIINLVHGHLEEGIYQHLRSEVQKLRVLEQGNAVDFM